MISMILGYITKQAHISYIHEAGIATIIGIIVSGFLALIGKS
jgi:sodium/hydrogen exchanger 8